MIISHSHFIFNYFFLFTGKRPASGRLSPRTLFGNLKVKRPFQEEDAVSRNTNNSKNTHGWKPPLKVDSNEACNKFSSHDCDMETLGRSFPNHEINLSQNHNFLVNESNYSDCNDNVYQTRNNTDFHIESGGSFPGSSKETTVHNRDLSNQNNLMNSQDLDYSEENICHDKDNYINNSETTVKQEPTGIQKNYKQDQEDRNFFQPLTEKVDFQFNNHEYLNKSFQEPNILETPAPSRNETHFEDKNYLENCTLSQETVALEKDNYEEFVDMKRQFKEEDLDYSEKSDSSNSTLELSESKKSQMKPKENKNVLPQEIIHGNLHENTETTKEFYITNGVDDSFDPGVTNSQFLQLENQISKHSLGTNMTNSYNSRPLLNNIETMKRYCSSLAAQTEWQKNILKSITRDIDDLK